MPMSPAIAWVFEDQLSLDLPSLKAVGPGGHLLMNESAVNFRRVPYHKKRLVFLVSAMRHFAEELRQRGYIVHYFGLNDSPYHDSLTALRRITDDLRLRHLLVTEPSEHHTREWLGTLPAAMNVSIEFVDNPLFLTDRAEFAAWAKSVPSPVMEIFYRKMRVEHRLLLDGDAPAGGEWNYDKQNRRRLSGGLFIPLPLTFEPDAITREAIADVERCFADHPGSAEDFRFAVTRADAEAYFADFLDRRLPDFGPFEDAMVAGEPLLYHSLLSPLLNAGLLRPLDCARAAEERY